MGTEIIHYVEATHIEAKSKCGLVWDKCKDYTNLFKYVTCKKCLNKLKIKCK